LTIKNYVWGILNVCGSGGILYFLVALAIFYTFGNLAPVHDRGNYSAFRQVALGVIIFPLICLVIWIVFDPQLSSGLINLAAVLTLGISGVFAYRRSQWLRLRFLGLSSLALIVAKFLPKVALFETVGLNSGNGDLAYYSILARFLRESSWRDTGWILDVNLATDLFDAWGNGGFTGASLLAGVSILTDSSPGEMALSVALALVITLGFASFLLLCITSKRLSRFQIHPQIYLSLAFCRSQEQGEAERCGKHPSRDWHSNDGGSSGNSNDEAQCDTKNVNNSYVLQEL
jgi:hypothetical protein